METLILAAMLYAQIPNCPKPFVNEWLSHRERAWRHMPRKCKFKGETGSYICTKDGCARP